MCIRDSALPALACFLARFQPLPQQCLLLFLLPNLLFGGGYLTAEVADLPFEPLFLLPSLPRCRLSIGKGRPGIIQFGGQCRDRPGDCLTLPLNTVTLLIEPAMGICLLYTSDAADDLTRV